VKCLNISAFLHRKKLKQRELAENLGVSVGFVGQLATSKSRVSYDALLKLIDLGITAEEMFGAECSQKLLQNSQEVQANSDSTSSKLKELEARLAKLEAQVNPPDQ